MEDNSGYIIEFRTTSKEGRVSPVKTLISELGDSLTMDLDILRLKERGVEIVRSQMGLPSGYLSRKLCDNYS